MLNNNKFTFVNVCFQHKHNEDRGLYKQTIKKDIAPLWWFCVGKACQSFEF